MTTKIGTAANYLDLLTILDSVLTATGHAWGLTFTGVGNGRLRGPGGTVGGYIGSATSVTETITITATSATSFNVVGSISGALGTATVGTDFASAAVNFRIVAGATPFVAGDFFRVNTGPKWQRLRFGGCPGADLRSGTMSNAALLFDNVMSDSTILSTTLPQYINVEMAVPTRVRAFFISNGNSTTATPRDFALQWSDDNSTWNTAQAWTGQTFTTTFQRKDYLTTADPGEHKYWRLAITASNSGTSLNLGEFRLFGDLVWKLDVSTRMEFAWKAPGVDGVQEIFVTGHTETTPGTDTWNIAFRGFRFWQDPAQSVVDVADQSGPKYYHLSKTPIAYWITVNGGRVILTTRISGVYQVAYIGFGLPYETPAIHPFPYLVGATGVNATYRWDATGNFMIRNVMDPTAVNSNPTLIQCALAAIFPSGTMEGIGNRYAQSSTAEGAAVGASVGKVWPYVMGVDGGAQPEEFRDNIDGTKPLMPCVILMPSDPVHTWGEFDGLYWTTGFGNTAEALLRDGAIDVMAVPNVYRTTVNAYSCVALD